MNPASINDRDVFAAHASAYALGAAMVAVTQDAGNRHIHLENARAELTRAANALGCTVKADAGYMVLMQATELKFLAGQDRHAANLYARASESDHLRHQLADATGKIEALETKVRILGEVEQGYLDEIARLRGVLDDRSKDWARLEDRAMWSKPVASRETVAA